MDSSKNPSKSAALRGAGREVPADLSGKLLAAAASFASSFDDVRMEDISRTSGVPRATLYYYFASKEDLLGFLLRHSLVGLAAAVQTAIAAEGDAATKLARVVQAQLSFLAQSTGTTELLVANLGKAAKLPDLLGGLGAAFHEPVESILREGVADGSLPPIDPELGAVALFGAVTMVGLRYVLRADDIDVPDLTARLLGLFFYGMPGPPRTSRQTRRRTVRNK